MDERGAEPRRCEAPKLRGERNLGLLGRVRRTQFGGLWGKMYEILHANLCILVLFGVAYRLVCLGHRYEALRLKF